MQIGDRLTDARLERTIEGPEAISLDVRDRDRGVLRSTVLGKEAMDGDTRVELDGVAYVAAGVAKAADTLTVTFEDAAADHLKRHGRATPVRVSRGTTTRAHFCAALIRQAGVPVLVLDEATIQPIAGGRKLKEELRKAKRQVSKSGRARTVSGGGGRGGGGTALTGGEVTVAGARVDLEQRRVLGLSLGVARGEGATGKDRIALVAALIVESRAKNLTYGDGGSVGPLQLTNIHLGGSTSTSGGRRDVALVARLFLRSGFSGKGGAIALARQNPGWTAGQVAQAVQGSAYPGRYQTAVSEALRIIRASGGDLAGTGTPGTPGTPGTAYLKDYAFDRRRGESTWDCCRRLLDEVRWRLFTSEGVVVIASDPALARSAPTVEMRERTGAVEDIDFDWHRGLRLSEATAQVHIDRWQADPGDVAVLDGLPVTHGRWLIATVSESLMRRTPLADVALRHPQRPKAEPAPQVVTTSGTPGTPGTAGGRSGGALAGGGGPLRDRIVRIAEGSMSIHTGYHYYSQAGALTVDPTPPAGERSDCSQWIRACYLKAGAGDPGTSTFAMIPRGRRVNNPRPGDLLIGPDHVEMFIGGDRLIGHGSPPIDYGSVAYWRARGFYFITYDFLDR